ncbi:MULTISPECIES: class II fructose-bisphosphate aldolase [unclassified Mycolicibacterium]|uniref:class II fructose-bisphosphate aldolase n=1 Tax=unclassified Mycolicibacterium TaxID=2636767 RepID=UPI001305E82C|nr:MULTISPECIES: class II fructose-bisphosphate aldolase [unclassified Mycolicibacterium]MUL83017.1 class II fructose-bisphosphate aldolase [Mycolicibacterium sp. CBMA 329]MUL89352.1 class II fructose-bisphosphate aldolase [Mycolicibacterium sp. CBMA 331]MUL99041.1 class II fructose-bisphosphate aldolase [Mycolicibacterium sp. CBMA 334]MUM25662.1 class II fructose-bisphosphate aldolase [Mycolicibacterium sp. CBMA 295]MUM38868.1 class II fructose-bisphosphate aldolase [Mycolicibacterium sp. CBM
MTLAATADLVASAAAQDTAVLAFNVITVEHAEGIAEGVERAGVAALMQVSENTVRFHGGRIAPLVSACAHIAARSSAELAVHLDHFQDPALITEAIDTAAALGVTSLMVDAAHLPYRDNVEQTHAFVQRAHQAGLWVEAELGEVGGKGAGEIQAHAPGARTDPDEAGAFARETGVDALAVAVGSSHAMTTRDARLDIDLIDALAARLAVPLVLHGSSGVPDDQLRLAVRAGIRKINVGTALNIAYSDAIRGILAADPGVTDPRPYLAAARQAIGDTVADLCDVVASSAAVHAGERDR